MAWDMEGERRGGGHVRGGWKKEERKRRENSLLLYRDALAPAERGRDLPHH